MKRIIRAKSITLEDPMFYDLVINCDDELLADFRRLGWVQGKNVIIPKGTKLAYIDTSNPGGVGYHSFELDDGTVIPFTSDDEEINNLLRDL